ncbi:large conductance mechanosensitive channel protein MscL [Bacillus tianshenii]|nr:large conductance mechanosensitive channel protein MscL [Bacillus tianshenii]
MGIGVIIGTAFGKIVDSLVSDILMPPLGLFLGKVNFSELFLTLSGGTYHSLEEAKEAGALTINYGVFIDSVIHFAIISFVTFMVIKQMNRIRKVPVSLVVKECPYCYSTIPTKAVRCPNCTTIINKQLMKEKEKLKVTIKAG